MLANLQFSVLGPVRVRRGAVEEGAGQPRQCAVLASLLLHAGSPVSLPALVDDVWGDEAPASSVGSIRTYIYRLRQLLNTNGDDCIRLSDGGYSLQIEPDALDINRFRRLVSRARAARACGDLTQAAESYAEGLALWSGPALAGVPGPYAEAQRNLMGELRLASLEEQLACDLERGRYVETAAELSALFNEHPLRERLCELFMTALYGAGRQSEALTAYHSISHKLRERLGVTPSPGLRKLHQLILTNELKLPATDLGPGHTPERLRTVLTAPVQLPADLPHFVGREEELERVSSMVQSGTPPSSMTTCVIGGMAGVGKTAFAVRLAHRMSEQFPDGQLFVDLGGFAPCGQAREPADVLKEFLGALGVPADRLPSSIRARAVLFRGLLANRRMMVVLDNVRSSDEVRDLLPGARGCMTIVTSRNQLRGLLATHQAVPLSLGPLSAADSWSLFAHGAGDARMAAGPAAAAEIVRLCGRLPLALSIIAARAAYRPSLSMERIAADMRAGVGPLDAFVDVGEPGFDVRTVLSWSYEALDPDSARLFRLLSVLPGPDLTEAEVAAVAGRSLACVRPLLCRLAQSHLLTETSPGRYHRHELVLAYEAEAARAQDDTPGLDDAAQRLADHYVGVALGAAEKA